MDKLTGWRHWLRALGAICRKDLQVFLSYPFNVVMRVVEPLMWLAPALFLGRAFEIGGRNPGLAAYTGTGDYVAFMVVGGIVSSYVSAVSWGMGFALKNEMTAGVLESNWLAPVPPLVQMVGRSLFSLVLTTINTLSVTLLVWLLFGFELTGSVLPVIVTLIPLLVALYGFGLGLAAIVLITNNAGPFADMGSFLLRALSGEGFPVTVLPRWLLSISLAIPLTYAYDVVRGQLLGTTTLLPISTGQLIIVALIPVTLIPGLLLFRRIERRCRDRGTLAQH